MIRLQTWFTIIAQILLMGTVALPGAAGQNLIVYPGDATDNGTVNNLDLLAIGLAYNFTGPKRDSIQENSFAFLPNEAVPWDLQLPGALNAAFADCDGSGKVNFNDVLPVFTNYGARRTDIPVKEDLFSAGLSGIDPVLGFDESALSFLLMPDDTISLPIVLGTQDIPAEDVYGLAFSVFSSGQFNPIKHFDFTQSSWVNDDGDRIFFYNNITPRRSDIGWTRTDRNQRDGYGTIGVSDFIIIIDVIDKVAPIQIWTDSIRMIDKYGNITALAGDTVTFQWHPNAFLPSTSVHETQPVHRISVHPNPADHWIHIQSDIPIRTTRLLNMLGQMVLQTQNINSNATNLHLNDLSPGCYILMVETTSGIERRIITIR